MQKHLFNLTSLPIMQATCSAAVSLFLAVSLGVK